MPLKKPNTSITGFFIPVGLILFVDLFLVRDFAWLKDNFHGIRFLVNYLLGIIGLLSMVYLLKIIFIRNILLKIIAFILIFLPLILELSYFSVYNKFIPPFGFSFFSENMGLTLSLYLENLRLFRTLLLVIATVIAFRLLFHHTSRVRIVPLICSIILLGAVIIHGVFGWYSVNMFSNGVMAFYNALIDNSLRSTGVFRINRPEVPKSVNTITSGKAPVIWIIGESTCLTHMSLYGYWRETTSCLDSLNKSNKLVAFRNAISVGNKTNLSVPYMLTGLEGPDPKGRFYVTPTIFAYAKAAGYKTAFLTAQDFKWGHMDKILIDRNVDEFVDGSSISSSVDVLEGIDDMLLLNKMAGPYIDSITAPFLLVLQMNGSHYPYSRHCPYEYKKFMPEKGDNSIEAYDNTVVYTDHFLGMLYKKALSRFPGCWIIFTPDHGQNIGGNGGLYNDSYLSDVVHNPLIIIPPTSEMDKIRINIDAPISQADIAATIMEIMDMHPLKPVNGLSLLKPIPTDRLRLCSEYMPTFHNNPSALLFLPDLSSYRIDFTKQSVLMPDGQSIKPYSTLNDTLRNYIESRLKGPLN